MHAQQLLVFMLILNVGLLSAGRHAGRQGSRVGHVADQGPDALAPLPTLPVSSLSNSTPETNLNTPGERGRWPGMTDV
jgi:hypothetical protein